MIEKKDVKRLIKARNDVEAALRAPDRTIKDKIFNPLGKTPGKIAAGILCRELSWLVNTNVLFWDGLRDASTSLAVHEKKENSSFRTMQSLLKAETEAFEKLGIDPEDIATVLAHAYDALHIIRLQPAPTPQAFSNLRDRLKAATELICKASKGPLDRAFGKLISLKGARILGGAAVAGGNVTIAVMGEGGVLSWASLNAGYYIMRGECDELWKIITGQDPN